MSFINYAINIFYPNVCGICNKLSKSDICPKCMFKLNEDKECKKHIYLTRNFTTHMYIFRYSEIIRKNLINYKFADQAYHYKSFANFMINDRKICGFIKKYDIIIPVPISKKRNKQRGYNQSELIIKEFAKKVKDIQVSTDILFKIKNTLPQSKLNKQQRKYNLENAYEVRKSGMINNKKILLFDDIFTTGSTVEECSKMLKKAGASEVRSINYS